jgi:radical SAM family uncharacterized protein
MNELKKFVTEEILPMVKEPAQYIGGEWNCIVKSSNVGGRPSEVSRVALAFPDTYSIGMSHLGLQILYFILNSREDVICERAFAPWVDMEEALRKNRLPLFTLETYTPLSEFDIIGFSLQYELTYTNVLNMLDLAGLPLRSSERSEDAPLVIAGGPGAFSPEPLAEFIDLFILGDGEESVLELVDQFKKAQKKGLNRKSLLKHLARTVPGAYVPSLYEVSYETDGTIEKIAPKDKQVPFPVQPALVEDLDAAPFPTAPIIPHTETPHERISLEIMRGCPRSCRFCQALSIKRPLRARSVNRLKQLAIDSIRSTGYSEISLASLSVSDYPHLEELVRQLNEVFEPLAVSISLPSVRLNEKVARLLPLMAKVRKSGLTFAPEAGSLRLRAVIDKKISDEVIFDTASTAYQAGWDLVKLYFMVGLPGETDEDIEAIGALSRKVSNLRQELGKPAARVNVTVAPFVPKAHTPFQWEAMAQRSRLAQIRDKLKNSFKRGRIWVKFNHIERSILEGVFSRGDRRLAKLLEAAWAEGAKFDAWNECFDFSRWEKAFASTGIDAEFYAHRQRSLDETLPWDHLAAGLSRDLLLKERQKSLKDRAASGT